jgi:hypothetical protein
MQVLTYLIFIAGVVSISCNPQSKSISQNNSQTTEVNQVLPKVSFEVKVLKGNNLQEGTHGDNSETELIFSIDGVKVDSFLEFGNALIENDENGNPIAYYSSDLSQVTISTEIIDGNKIVLSKTLFFDGEERRIWTRIYTKSNDTWKMSECEGECN